MTSATKAALLSGLIFPGLGHLLLKKYVRGGLLALISLTALYVLVTESLKQAMPIVDDIVNGKIAGDFGSIMEASFKASAGQGSSAISYAFFVIVLCWLFGIVDSYRLGRKAAALDGAGKPVD